MEEVATEINITEDAALAALVKLGSADKYSLAVELGYGSTPNQAQILLSSLMSKQAIQPTAKQIDRANTSYELAR